MTRRTFILCNGSEGHVIGEVVRRNYHDEMVSALYVYEHSVESVALAPTKLPAKRFIALGDAVGIECTICRRERNWTISNKAAVSRMVSLLNALYEPAARKDEHV